MIVKGYTVVCCRNSLDRLLQRQPLGYAVPQGFSRPRQSLRSEGTVKVWVECGASAGKGKECSSGIGIEVGYLGLEGRSCQIRRPSRLPNYQIGLPSLSRKTKVSFPRWISRAKMVSTSSNFTFEPMTSIASPLLKTSS